ncbi:MAG TPA: hypothetical protein DEF00_02235 [Candidatus Taylorbacteria bacterium]|nr:MAG: dTDP-glucose 4,6-dehydratase [Parcubacteria group bacterium GW2011_GWA2_47_64]KKU96536.1 MAG: dTDP-glucose 4,6-dehydratase [Parcubacteria group bacterium GW2011_GWC2_48_17]HBV01195.1 hypothetical protein [Candidatus Taylorbacteria bacterium]
MTLSSKLDGPVLITGASGFVGSHVVRKLVSDGARVHALVRKTSNLWRIQDILHDITLEYADLADSESIAQAITKVKPKGIFHLGVSNVVSGLGAKNETIIQTNALGTVALLDAASAASFDFFVMTGSFLEYGFKDHPVREDELCEPGELYGVSKLAGTLYGAALGRSQKKPIVALRLFTPYGPFNEPQRLTHQVIASALHVAPIALTSPTISRDFIFVDDAVELILEASQKAGEYRGEIFNAGSGVRTPIGDAVSYILEQTSSKSEVKWGSFRSVSYDSDTWQADMTKTFSHFSWRPKYSLHEGLDKTIEHFRKYGC